MLCICQIIKAIKINILAQVKGFKAAKNAPKGKALRAWFEAWEKEQIKYL